MNQAELRQISTPLIPQYRDPRIPEKKGVSQELILITEVLGLKLMTQFLMRFDASFIRVNGLKQKMSFTIIDAICSARRQKMSLQRLNFQNQ